MTPERWQELKDLLNEALEVPASERTGFLAKKSLDEELLQEVESLLAVETQVGDFIEKPASVLHAAADSGDRAGQRVGPYRLVEEIGRGGMGTVYCAERADETFDKTVAVKVLKRGLDTDEVVRRFRAERQILAGLEHPNIARLLDGGTTGDGLPYLVMEYVDGVPVDVYCREEGLSVDQRLHLFLQVCSAIQLAHRNLVVHRDLKPSNILVTADGVPKLLDFGIAKLLDPNLSDGLMTVAGWQFLTPEYASPEQIEGGPVTTAADVYSLGVLLYLLLAGRRPYDLSDRSMDGLARALQAGDPPRPSAVAPAERAPRIRGDLDNIVLMALRREPERRYGTVEQLADDLHRHLQGRPVRATPDSLGYRAGKFIRRNKLPVAVAAAFVALVVSFSVVAWALAEEASANAETAGAVTESLIGMIEGADPDNSQGAELTVRQVFEEGREVLAPDGDLADQPAVRAALWQTFGRVSLALDQGEQARQDFEAALELRRKHFGERSPWVAESLSSLGHYHVTRNSWDEAEELTRQALSILREHRAPEAFQVIQARSNLASIHANQDRTEAAEKEYRELIPLWRKQDMPLELARVQNNYGVLLSDLGRYEEALPPLQEALSVRRELGKKSELAATINALGSVMKGLGEIDEAVALYRERVAIDRDLYDENHSSRAVGLNNLATALQVQGRREGSRGHLQEAADALREAIEISQISQREGHRAIFQRNLASVLIDLGDLRQAEEVLEVALPVLREEADLYHALYGEAILGSLRAAQGRHEEAEELLSTSLDRLLVEANVDPTHDSVRDTRRRLEEVRGARGRTAMAEPDRRASGTPPATAAPGGS